MTRSHLLLSLLLALSLVTACRPSSGETDHAPAAQAETEHGHEDGGQGHEEAALPTRAVTIFTPRSELFAEHPFLVVDTEAPFAAHLTDLKDFTPVAEGRLEVVLTPSFGDPAVFSVDGVLRPGIFRPVVKPTVSGTYRMSFRVTSPKLTDTIDAGKVTVYPDAQSAVAAAPRVEEDPEEIAFLKEQQWKIPFATQVVKAGTVAGGGTVQGTVKPAGGREVAIAAPAAGRIVVGSGRLPQLGAKVRQGEVLAILTPVGDAGQDRASLEQAVTSAEAALTQAGLDLARAERLLAAQAAPARRVEEARTAVTIAESRLAAARRQLDSKEAALSGNPVATEESFRLKAPITGTVVEAPLVPGSFVSAGAPLYRIVDLDTVWVEARVPEVDLHRLGSASKADITVPGAPPVRVGGGRGRLVTLGSVLDPANHTAPVVFAVPNPDGRFRIGMSAEVRLLSGSSRPGPVVPAEAVVDDNGRPIAYVQTGGESFERRELVLAEKEQDRVLIESGLAPGDRVVTKGGYEIRLSTLSNAVPAHGHEH